MNACQWRRRSWLAAAGLVSGGAAWIALGGATPDSGFFYPFPEPNSTGAARSDSPALEKATPSADRTGRAAPRGPSPPLRPPSDTSASATRIVAAYAPAVVQPDAAHSLAQALNHGDERSPPIGREENPADAPTPAELANPAAYRRYENRRQEGLYRAYEQQAVMALGEMQRDLQRARDAQLPPELIQEGEEKAARLAQTLHALRQGELGEAAAAESTDGN